MKQTETFEEWVESIVYALLKCPDVHADEVVELVYKRQQELEQEPDSTLSIYSHGMTLPTDKDYEV